MYESPGSVACQQQQPRLLHTIQQKIWQTDILRHGQKWFLCMCAPCIIVNWECGTSYTKQLNIRQNNGNCYWLASSIWCMHSIATQHKVSLFVTPPTVSDKGWSTKLNWGGGVKYTCVGIRTFGSTAQSNDRPATSHSSWLHCGTSSSGTLEVQEVMAADHQVL